jgi:hypothetical protein
VPCDRGPLNARDVKGLGPEVLPEKTHSQWKKEAEGEAQKSQKRSEVESSASLLGIHVVIADTYAMFLQGAGT